MSISLPEWMDKLALSPMAAITDAPFRKIAREFGAGLTFTQMVSAKGVLENNFETLQHLAFNKSEKPIGVQMLGNDPRVMEAAAREIRRFDPDVIDLNSACPQSAVTKFKLGACLMDDPKILGSLVGAIKKGAGSIPVTVKLRLGRDKNRINIIENAKAAEDNGASALFVHARTREDRYDSEVRYEWLARVTEAVNIPIIGNGSLFDPADVKQMLDETGCVTGIVARGALGNPFLFRRWNILKKTGKDPGAPDVDTVAKTALTHIDLLKYEYGEIKAVTYAKKNILWYYRYHKGIDNLLEKVMDAGSLDNLKEIVEEHTEKIKNVYEDEPERIGEIEEKFRKKVLFWLAKSDIAEGY